VWTVLTRHLVGQQLHWHPYCDSHRPIRRSPRYWLVPNNIVSIPKEHPHKSSQTAILIVLGKLVYTMCAYLNHGPTVHSLLHEDALRILFRHLCCRLDPYGCLTNVYRLHFRPRSERPRCSRNKLWHVHVSIKHHGASLLLPQENLALTCSAAFLHMPFR
jgi:hypothetical protein